MVCPLTYATKEDKLVQSGAHLVFETTWSEMNWMIFNFFLVFTTFPFHSSIHFFSYLVEFFPLF